MRGICALYDNETELLESHIYPKFVINYTKKTGSKYLRKFTEPNARKQDGIKLHLLSEKAEQDFSVREKWFAENIFVPYLGQKFELEYNENLYYFAVSFLWRVLILELKTDKSLKDKWYYDIILQAEKEWKEYLITGKLPRTHKQFSLFFTDRVKVNNSGLKGVDFYLTRILDATIADNEPKTCLLLYGKFSRFVFWAVLKNFGGEEDLRDVEINPKGGKFNIPQKLEYFPLLSLLSNRIRTVDEMVMPNEEQQKKIEQEILKDPKAFWKSDIGQSLFNDNFNL
ncbi:hypothetical protein FCR2A7T_24080 [Flavobacterium cauense R2A-7]|uniref:Uncharacterized protein n=1 Tax=Flavobacterium cauense R2A-7 TaxID=1341154 RepID=V6RWY1_9FLAO|nr:hypothetical protein [Flavobacterium cauense]ESU18996.1 hypothetical protein FCR2A7T_24080 [Flavobacterium cauense R2A-7]TWI15341.1 hypothetical protein IP98_00333 [Flavobacterium cauense R2A-7]